MLNLIDEVPLHTGWGRVYQSGELASLDWKDDGLILSASGNLNFQGPCLWFYMADNDLSVLPEKRLFAVTATAIQFLSRGFDVLIHCNEGKYRSTYIDVAVHMAAGMGFVESFQLVKTRHSIADLRVGTLAQLKELQPHD
jgi:hypothetical protein